MTDNKSHVFVALLRGINVGGNNKVSMAELKACFEKSGYSDVSTYINSGNVIFRSETSDQHKLAIKIEKTLNNTFGLPISVVVRSLDDIEKLISQMPDSWQSATDIRCYVLFLRPSVDNPEIMNLFQPKPKIDEAYYHPGAVFWATKLSGLTKSNLDKIIGTPIYKEITIRNQNTTRKLYSLMQALNTA